MLNKQRVDFLTARFNTGLLSHGQMRELLQHAQETTAANPTPAMPPANAVVFFGSWLTVRHTESGPFGAFHEAGQMAELTGLFNEVNGWEFSDTASQGYSGIPSPEQENDWYVKRALATPVGYVGPQPMPPQDL